MEVDRHKQAKETDEDKDGSTELGVKEKRSSSKESDGHANEKNYLNMIVGNGSRDSDSCDSSKPEEKMSSDGVEEESEKTSYKEPRQECVMNGDLSDHSSLSNSSEIDVENEKGDDKRQEVTEKSASSSQNGTSVNEDILPKEQLEEVSNDKMKVTEKESKSSEDDRDDQNKESKHSDEDSSVDDLEESKSSADENAENVPTEEPQENVTASKYSEAKETEENKDDDRESESSSTHITDADSEKDSNDPEESKTDNSEEKKEDSLSDVKSEESKKDSEKSKPADGDDSEKSKSDDADDSEKSKSENADDSEKSKPDDSEAHERGGEGDNCVSEDGSDKPNKDKNTDAAKSKPIEKKVEDPDRSSSIMKDKRNVADFLSSKPDRSFSPETSLVGNPPFINVTYSARGPVPVVSNIGNNLTNTSSSLRMVVPMKSGPASQTRPQYQNQFQFYLQGPPGNNTNQYVSVLNAQGGIRPQGRQINNKLQEKVEPPRAPQSSMDMIELSRWEVKQGLHRRARNTKIRPESELSNIARFLRDFGQDLVKEAVYSDLVKIQHKRNAEGKLKSKEAEDFKKLKSVHHELHEKVGPCKVQFSRKCSCGFKTESINVMYSHKQRPHIDMYDMCCAYCSFTTRNPHAFKFHLEGEHNVKPIIEMKQPLWECNLCPYEHNIKNKLTQHKFKCTKNFKLHLNLHPAWMPGPETNFCLENMMYKLPVVKAPQLQTFNKQTVRAQPKIAGPRQPSPRVNDTIQQINAARAQAQQMMKFGAQRPGIAPNVNFFQNNAAMQRNALKTGPSILGGNRAGFNRMPTTTAMPQLQMKQQVRSQTPKMSMVTPKSASANVTSKINHLITMNDNVLDIAAKGQTNSGFEICEICGGYVKDRTALRIHFFYAHRIDMPYAVFDRIHPPLYCATCFSRFWTAQGLQKHLDVHKEDSSGGVAGKCVVCGHRVPNILMHMRIVHNKALNNFLKECKCIFCGTSFQNKTNVENHMAAIHGVVVKSGAPVESPAANSTRQTTDKPGQPPSQKSGTALVKGSVCVLCNLNFGRNVDLTRHCMKVHHTCMKCGMVVADKLSLMKHTCLESAAGLRNCELCGDKGFHPAYHVKHIRDKHLKKCSVKVAKMSADQIKKAKHNLYLKEKSKSSSDNEVIDVDSRPSPAKKYKQCKDAAKLYRDSIKLGLDHNSDSDSSNTSKKRKRKEIENKDNSDKSETSVKKSRTDEKSRKEDKAENKNIKCNVEDSSGKAKPTETSSAVEASPSDGDEKVKTDSLKKSSRTNEMDTSEEPASSSNPDEIHKRVQEDKDDELTKGNPKQRVRSPSNNLESIAETKGSPPPEEKCKSETPPEESAANDGDSSSDEEDGGAFCGFQSLTKPDKDKDSDADNESGDSDSDSE